MNRAGDWLHQAQADLAQAQLSAETGHHEWACFASHQAAEKALKALHLHQGLRVRPRITSAACKARTLSPMPVRSLTQSVLRWPQPEQVLQEVEAWASEQRQAFPNLQRVGVYGSYGRGDACVGSDLDLVLVVTGAAGPQQQRLVDWPLERLPLSCDALVLTPEELAVLLSGGNRMAEELQRDLRWLD